MASFNNPKLELTYTVKISYLGGLTRSKRESIQVLDLSMYKGLMTTRESGMNDLVKAIEEIKGNTEKIASKLENITDELTEGIWIKNPSLPIEVLSPETWLDSLMIKLKEFQILWLSVYGKKEDKQLYSFFSVLQNKATLISQQLPTIIAACPTHTPTIIIDEVSKISEKLSDLGKKQFYHDGGLSIQEFDVLGDELVELIEDVKKQLHSMNLYESHMKFD